MSKKGFIFLIKGILERQLITIVFIAGAALFSLFWTLKLSIDFSFAIFLLILAVILFRFFYAYFISSVAETKNYLDENKEELKRKAYLYMSAEEMRNLGMSDVEIFGMETEGVAKVSSWEKMVEDSRDDIQSIQAAANGASGDLAAYLNKISDYLGKIKDHIYEDQTDYSQIARLFSYYIPKTASILVARGAALRFGDLKSVAQIDEMIERLTQVYEEFWLRLYGSKAHEIKIDLKLLDQSLETEFPSRDKI